MNRHSPNIRKLADRYEQGELNYDELLWAIMMEMGGPDNIEWRKDFIPRAKEKIAKELRELAERIDANEVYNLGVLIEACEIVFRRDEVSAEGEK